MITLQQLREKRLKGPVFKTGKVPVIKGLKGTISKDGYPAAGPAPGEPGSIVKGVRIGKPISAKLQPPRKVGRYGKLEDSKLKGDQHELDTDNDGDIDAKDMKNLRNRKKSKKDKEVATPNAKLSSDKGTEPDTAVESVEERYSLAQKIGVLSNPDAKPKTWKKIKGVTKSVNDPGKQADHNELALIKRMGTKEYAKHQQDLKKIRNDPKKNWRLGGSGGDSRNPTGSMVGTREEFEPHKMYKDGKVKMANTHADHVKLGKQGWSHDNPKTKNEAVNPHDDDGANHIAMQMRKVITLRGMRPVEFKDGKKVRVEPSHAQQWLTKYNKAKPLEKEKMQSMAQKSHGHFKKSLDENVFKKMAGAVSGAVRNVKDAYSHAQTHKHLTNMVNKHNAAAKAGGPDAEKHAETAKLYGSALHHHQDIEGDPTGKKRNSYINDALKLKSSMKGTG